MSQDAIAALGLDLSKFSPKVTQAIEQLETLYTQLKRIEDSDIAIGSKGGWTELTAKTKAQEKAVADYNKTLLQLERTKQAALKTEQETIKTIREEAKAEKELERTKQETMRTKKQELQYELALAKEKAKGLSQQAAEQALARKSIDYRAQMNRQLKEQEVLYFNVAKSLGVNSQEAEIQLKKTLDMRTEIEKLDNNLRNYQKNVGNYRSAFDGLGTSFSQVARELPSLAINTQTFLLAISNNLPMVFDEISKAKNEIKALREQGEQTPGLFARLGKSIFSMNVFLSIAVTLFTLFGDKIIKGVQGLFGYTDATEKAAENTAKLNKAQLELIKSQEELHELYRDPINDIDRLEKQLQISQSLGKSKGDILELEKRIAATRAADATAENERSGGFTKLEELTKGLSAAKYEVDSLKQAFLNATDEDVQKNIQKQIDRAQIGLDLAKKQFDDQEVIVRNYYKTLTDLTEKQNQLDAYNAEQKILLETETAKIQAQTVIDSNERILADERNFEAKRAAALKSTAAQRKAIIDQEEKAFLSDPSTRNDDGTLTSEAIVAQKEFAAARLKIDKDLQVELFNNSEEFRKRRLAAELETLKAEKEFAAATYREISELETRSFDERMVAYGDFYQKEQELIAAEFQYQLDTKVMTSEELVALEAATQKKLLELVKKGQQEISNIVASYGATVIADANRQDANRLSREQLSLYKSMKSKIEFAKQEAKAERAAAIQRLNNEEFQLQENIRTQKLGEQEYKKQTDRLTDIDTERNRLYLAEVKETDAQAFSVRDYFLDQGMKSAQTTFALLQALSDNYYNKRIAALEREKELLQDNGARELENIRNSTLSEQEKAAQIAILTAQQDQKEQEIERRQKAEKIKQAKTDKAIAIASIIVQTALAVVESLPNVYLAAAAGAAGAAQLAVAIATKIPEYGDGTEDHPGGPAIIGERHKPERVTEPSGKSYIISRPTLIRDLPKHTRVDSNIVNNALYSSMITGTAERIAMSDRAQPSDAMLREVRDAVIGTGYAQAQAIRKVKHTSVVNVNLGWEAKLWRDVRG